MTNSATKSEQAVEALFAERQQYEGWLAALEGRRAATPAHIYHRVHADYTARLQRVMEELGTHRAVLQELESTLMDRLTSLDIDEAKYRDEAAEAELRAAVGELTPEQHREVAERAESALASIAGERESLAPELSRVRSVLDLGAPAPAEDEAGRAHEGAGASAGMAGREPAHSGATESDVPEDSDHGSFDELNFLKSLVTPPSEATAVPSGVGAADSHGGASAARSAAASHSSGHSGADAATSQDVQNGAGRTAVDSGSMPAYLRDVQPEQVKTLKCQECGTLNYPTEWYCERCGAELAAL
ncbi:MAG TPA: zinc finger Ran-binding domain-containing protein [Gemmatimonadaceae bacterium]|nr:zinc finger Ran-binding domain-containing protein [Gemmatimonadaceae bacterium]